jgi:hypothetical protein
MVAFFSSVCPSVCPCIICPRWRCSKGEHFSMVHFSNISSK